MALVIPTLCGGETTSEQLTNAIAQVKHREIREWEKVNIASTIRKQRRAFMQATLPEEHQKPGNIAVS